MLRVAFGVFCVGTLWAGPLTVPNNSFESPVTSFVNTHVDSWQKNPKPDWYVESGGYTWDQLAGVFQNTPVTSADHIDNCDGNQALWMFVVPDVGLFQDFNSTDWTNVIPTHAFNQIFTVGSSYQLTVGVIGGGGNMATGVTMEISLYYRDAASNLVTVVTTSITNTPEIFSNTTHLVDFQVNVPTVRPGDAWAGQHIGVKLLSTVSLDLEGGYWDLDNVRLVETREPSLTSPVMNAGKCSFTLQSEPGLRLEVLAASDCTAPLSNWTSLGTLTNVTGSVSFTDAATNLSSRFYKARQVP